MTTTTVTVNNPTRSRKFGWAFSTRPTGRGTEIAAPAKAEYTGTIKQVRSAIKDDAFYANCRSGGTYMSSAWFYDGKKIVGVQNGDAVVSFSEALNYGLFDTDSPLFEKQPVFVVEQ